MDTLTLAVLQTERIPTIMTPLFSCDDAQTFHFPVKPEAIHQQHNRDHKRSDRADYVNRGTHYEVHPETPHASAQRQ
jgi:hypothetical protein